MFHHYIPTPEESITQVTVNCTVQTMSTKREPRTYIFKRAKLKNGYLGKTSQGSFYYTDKDQGPQGEEITRTIEWVLPLIGEYKDWEDVNIFLELMRAKDINYKME